MARHADHRPLQQSLPLSGVALQRAAERRHRRGRADVRCGRRPAPSAPCCRAVRDPARRSDAARSAGAIPAHAARDAADLAVSGHGRAHGVSATSPAIRFAPRPPSSASRFAVAILMIGFVFNDAIDRLITDAVLGGRAAGRHRQLRRAPEHAARGTRSARLPGVIAVEPQRTVAVRVRAAHRERYLAITGVPADSRLQTHRRSRTASRSACPRPASCSRRRSPTCSTSATGDMRHDGGARRPPSRSGGSR